jgi:hypothetical protein
VKYAKQQGADAVIDVRSVVFFEDGSRETYQTAECSDEGDTGQILAQGVAVRWKTLADPKPEAASGAWDKPPGAPPDTSSLDEMMKKEAASSRAAASAASAPPQGQPMTQAQAGTPAPGAAEAPAPALAPRDFSSVPVLGGELPPAAREQAAAARTPASLPQAQAAARASAPQGPWPAAPAAQSAAPAPVTAPAPAARIEMPAEPASPALADQPSTEPGSAPPPRKRRKRRPAAQPPRDEDVRQSFSRSNRVPSPTDIPGM